MRLSSGVTHHHSFCITNSLHCQIKNTLIHLLTFSYNFHILFKVPYITLQLKASPFRTERGHVSESIPRKIIKIQIKFITDRVLAMLFLDNLMKATIIEKTTENNKTIYKIIDPLLKEAYKFS